MRAAIADYSHAPRAKRVFDERSALYVIGICLTFIAPLPLYWLFAPPRDFTEAGLYLAIAEIVVALFVTIHFFAKDSYEIAIFCIGLYGKLAASGLYLKLCYSVYVENDAFGYFNRALALVSGGVFQWDWPPTGTNAISNLTAIVIGLGSPSITLGYCTFAIIGFFGQMLLYRAFCVGVPQGNRKLAALLCFFFPSLVYWTSPIGKDAIVLFGLGLAALGAARLFAGRNSLVPILVGLLIVQLIRPHIAALFGGALAICFILLWRPPNVTAALFKFLIIPLLAVLSLWLTLRTQSQFYLDSVEGSITRAEQIRGFKGARGGSDFGYEDTLQFRFITSPFLLLRPFPWEVGNFFSALASAEGVIAFLVLCARRRTIAQLFARFRAYPFVWCLVLYATFVILSLSAVINNMGTLARQRVMAFPMFLVIACIGVRRPQPVELRSWRPRPAS